MPDPHCPSSPSSQARLPLMAPARSRRRFVHRQVRSIDGPEIDEREPLAGSSPGLGGRGGLTTSILILIDRALERHDLESARRLTALLPGDDPDDAAVVDRRATLALAEGALDRAAATLARTSASSPRIDLLRAILALRQGDPVTVDLLCRRHTCDRGVALRILARLIAAVEETDRGHRLRADTAIEIRRAADAPGSSPERGLFRIRRSLRSLTLLLGGSSDRRTVIGVIVAGLRGVAVDLGLDPGDSAEPRPHDLGVTAEDLGRLRLRAAG